MADLLDRLKTALADRYAIERELGRGGMATVYLAEDLKHRRKVAIKVLKPELAAALGPDRFLREIELSARLRHPHILPLHDSGEAAGFLYYVMPYVAGETLRDRLNREQQLPLEDALQITREVVDALSYAHSHDVVHRDIKPENILLESGHAVVADFGIARAITSAADEPLTGTGVVIGTPAYMSPEQAAGSTGLDGRSDVYSLGCVFYEMLAGQPPFTGPTVESIVRQHLAAPSPDITVIRRGVPVWVATALSRALAKTPADRFQPIAMFAEALARRESAPLPTAIPVRKPEASHRSWSVALLGIAGIAAIVVFAAWMISRLPKGPGADGAASAGGASIAVLPFDNLSGDRQKEYFSDGMSEQIIYALGRVEGLRVSPRASAFAFRDRGAALREIGSQLHVAHVLEGTLRQAGNRLRVNVQLISVASGNADWSEEYQRDLSDVFQMQDDIARAIVEALRGRLTAGVTGTGTRSVEAYDLYLKGRYFYERRTAQDLIDAGGLFKQAIEKDPSYARAYAGLSDTYALQGILGLTTRDVAAQPAQVAAAAALRLDNRSAEAYTSFGFVRLFYDWDWPGARGALERAIALDARYAPARLWHMWYFVAANQLDSALREAERGAELDPMVMASTIGRMLQLAGRHGEAVAVFQKLLLPDSTNAFLQARIAPSLVAVGRCADALRAINWVHPLADTFDGMPIGFVLASCNRKAEARARAADLERRSSQLASAPEQLVAIYSALGEKDKAFAWMERAYAEHSGPLYKLRVEPTFVNLRSDPRLHAMARRMHLP